jgi:hypothetical protein
MSYSAQHRRNLREIADELQHYSEKFKEWSSQEEKGDLDKSVMFAGIGTSFFHLSKLSYLVINQLQDLNSLFDSIEKLPKGVEFDKLKEEVEKIKSSGNEVTIQVPDNIVKELKEWLGERERAKKAQRDYVT